MFVFGSITLHADENTTAPTKTSPILFSIWRFRVAFHNFHNFDEVQNISHGPEETLCVGQPKVKHFAFLSKYKCLLDNFSELYHKRSTLSLSGNGMIAYILITSRA